MLAKSKISTKSLSLPISHWQVLIAVSHGSQIHLWNVSEQTEVASFDLEVTVESVLFIASGA